VAELQGWASPVSRARQFSRQHDRTDLQVKLSFRSRDHHCHRAIIDTAADPMTQSVTNKQIDSLPLLAGLPPAMLTPGVSVGSYDTSAITANGARPLSGYNIDGASSNNDFYPATALAFHRSPSRRQP